MKVRIKSFNGELPDYLTVGKEYELDENARGNGWITNDIGFNSYIRMNDCCHLNGGSWEIVDESN